MNNNMRVLVVQPGERDWAALQSIFAQSNWLLFRADRLTDAGDGSRSCEPCVVLCPADLPGGGWREALRLVESKGNGAPVVVFGRDIEEALWVEVLSAGGYDVLMLPFDKREVFRSVTQAWRHWKRACPEHMAAASA